MVVVFIGTALAVWGWCQALWLLWTRRAGRAAQALRLAEYDGGQGSGGPFRPGRARTGDTGAGGPLPFPLSVLNRRLARGAVAISPQTAILVAAAGAVVAWAVAATLTGPGRLADLAIPAGLWAPFLWVDRLAARRRDAVSAEMERVATALEAAVTVGMNAYEAMLEVGVAHGGILGPHLLRTIEDADRVGMSEALALLSRRLPLPEVRLLVASMRLNQGTGSELGSTLAGLAGTLRERRESAAALRSATAAGRWQANMLVAVPPLLLFFMRYAYPSFETPLFGTATGQLLLVLAMAWLAVGWVLVRRMAVPPAVC